MAASEKKTLKELQRSKSSVAMTLANDEMKQGSDRACAIVGGALLDFVLLYALRVCLIHVDERELNTISTFSARIRMVYFFRVISKAEREELDVIRNIRNHFAHTIEGGSFEERAVIEECKKLSSTAPTGTGDLSEARKQYMGACLGLAQVITSKTSKRLRAMREASALLKKVDAFLDNSQKKQIKGEGQL